MSAPTKECRLCGFDFPCADWKDPQLPGLATVCERCIEKATATEHAGLQKTNYPGIKRLICPYCATKSEVTGVETGELWYYGLDCPRCQTHASLTFRLWTNKYSSKPAATGKHEARQSFYE